MRPVTAACAAEIEFHALLAEADMSYTPNTTVEELPVWIAPRWDSAEAEFDYEFWEVFQGEHASKPKFYAATITMDALALFGVPTTQYKLAERWVQHVENCKTRCKNQKLRVPPMHVSEFLCQD